MLILNRRAGEAILIDGGIRIVVLASDGGGVRLGIEAPSSVGIVREEVVQRIAEENIRAGATEDQRKWLEGLSAGPGGVEEEMEGGGEEDDDEGDEGDGESAEQAGKPSP